MSLDWQIRELQDKAEIRRYLEPERIYAAYALGDLEESLFPLCRWWLAESNPLSNNERWALILHYRGLTPHAVICLGDPSGVGELLAQVDLPEMIYLICRPEHIHPTGLVLALQIPQRMARMVLAPERFEPTETAGVTRLAPDRLADLQTLYAQDPSAADAFAPYQLEQGIFYGVEQDGRLISAAGTHLVAPSEGIGAVGNIFTLPSFREQGHAGACTSAVCKELLAQGLTTVLNVGTDNAPAIRLYNRLGFDQVCIYYESIAKFDKEKLDVQEL